MLAERLGWTFDYIDEMDYNEFLETVAIYEAIDGAKNHLQKRAARGS